MAIMVVKVMIIGRIVTIVWDEALAMMIFGVMIQYEYS